MKVVFKTLSHMLGTCVLILACFCLSGVSPAAAAEDSGSAWVKAMETHAGLKGLIPLAGCTFKLDEYTVVDGIFSSKADIPEKAIADFISRLWKASKSVSTSGISKAETRSMNRGPKPIEDIINLDISGLDQIRWTYHYDSGSREYDVPGKVIIITIRDKRNVSFMLVPVRK